MRRQLPGTSPISAGALVRALTEAVTASGVEERLRDLLAHRFQATAVGLYGSGTEALQAAMAAAHERAGGPVALPGYSCFDMATAAVGAGVPVTFYDLDPVTLAPEPESLEYALEGGARVVVAANLYGFPLDWDFLRQAAERHDALIVEDAAQGVGSRWRGREGGSFGDLTVLSFGRGKGWTGGGGGALLTRGGRATLPAAPTLNASGARALAVGLAHWSMGRPRLFWLPHAVPGLHLGETVYREPGRPGRMSRLSAALVLATEGPAREAVEGRGARAATWRSESPEPTTLEWPRPVTNGVSADLRLPLLAPPGAEIRAGLLRRLQRFGAAPGYPAVLRDIDPLAPFVVSARRGPLEGAHRLVSRLFTLPTHGMVTDRDIRLGAAILREFAGG